jgi:uroporphyrinogen III methyltransferase / synthase
MIFVSVNGVNGFMQRVRDRGLDPVRYNKAAIYAVGPKTAEELETQGMKVAFIPDRHTADALGRHLSAGDIRGKRFLFPRGNLGKEALILALSEAGAEVETVEVYRTIVPEMAGAESLVQRVLSGDINVLAFASPSAVKNFAGILPGGGLADLGARTTIAAIGPSTLEMIRSLGGRGALVAKTSTAKGLADVISQHFSDHE